MNKQNHTGFLVDNILLSIARALLRKEERDNYSMTDDEVRGHAMVLQGRYGFVSSADTNLFCNEILNSFNYLKQRNLTEINKVAYAQFKLHELTGNSILDSVLIEDLRNAGYN